MTMNRRELESLLLTLESTPALIVRAAEELGDAGVRRHPSDGGFSFVEHVWHLADLEREAYGQRIRRILQEDGPSLADFEGERLARERVYRERDLTEGLTAFAVARNRNVLKLRSIRNSDWKRTGRQDGVGTIALEDIPRMMADHDRAHTSEIANLIAHLKEGRPFRAQPSSAVA
jgi:DinB superfamily